MPLLKASHLEVFVALMVVFDGHPPPLGSRLVGGAKSDDVKSELLRRQCSSATMTRGGLSFVRERLLRVWSAVIGNGALVLLQEVGAALRAAFELGNDDLRDLGPLPTRLWSSGVCFGKSELLVSNQLGNDDSLQCCVVPRHLGGLVIQWFG